MVDNDESKVQSLRVGEVPIHEALLPELLERHGGTRIHFSTDIQSSFRAQKSRSLPWERRRRRMAKPIFHTSKRSRESLLCRSRATKLSWRRALFPLAMLRPRPKSRCGDCSCTKDRSLNSLDIRSFLNP